MLMKAPINLELPDSYKGTDLTIITNFDHSIDQEVADKIKNKELCADYCGWNFFGRVWWDGQWHCEIKQYQCHMETISADTLFEIHEQVCSKYGSD